MSRMKTPVKSWRPKLSQAWVLVCNLGIFALTICILASCRTAKESNYSLVNIDQKFLKQSLGNQCYDSTKVFRPDVYRIGLSGSCRVKDGVTSCESHGPRINWVSQLEADITAANVSDSQGVILDRCVKTLNERGPDHSFTSRLATAMFALLVISTILNVSGIIAAVFYGSGFAKPIFIIGLIDEMILVTCIGIFLGLLNHEVGKYIPATVALRDIDDKAILGVGFWMLIAAFGARAISHPLLFLITLVVALLVVLVPISLLLACCLGSDRRKQTVEDVQRRIIFVFRVTDSPRDSRW